MWWYYGKGGWAEINSAGKAGRSFYTITILLDYVWAVGGAERPRLAPKEEYMGRTAPERERERIYEGGRAYL